MDSSWKEKLADKIAEKERIMRLEIYQEEWSK